MSFQRGGGAFPRTVDLSGIQLNVGVASVLSDVFTIEWGLRKLVFKECDLDEHVSTSCSPSSTLLTLSVGFETDAACITYPGDIDLPFCGVK